MQETANCVNCHDEVALPDQESLLAFIREKHKLCDACLLAVKGTDRFRLRRIRGLHEHFDLTSKSRCGKHCKDDPCDKAFLIAVAERQLGAA